MTPTDLPTAPEADSPEADSIDALHDTVNPPLTGIPSQALLSTTMSLEPGKLIVFTGPSGVGKGTLLKALFQRHPELTLSVSATTRAPREGEVEGQHYYFMDREAFKGLIEANELLEWAEFASNFYGTPRRPLEALVKQGKRVILEIELEGARQVRSTYPKALQIFVSPPSLQELEARIRQRGQDSEDAIARRLQRAKVEIEAKAEFDVQVMNDDLDKALHELERILFKDR